MWRHELGELGCLRVEPASAQSPVQMQQQFHKKCSSHPREKDKQNQFYTIFCFFFFSLNKLQQINSRINRDMCMQQLKETHIISNRERKLAHFCDTFFGGENQNWSMWKFVVFPVLNRPEIRHSLSRQQEFKFVFLSLIVNALPSINEKVRICSTHRRTDTLLDIGS